jgi:superfamily II DNA/RNA helicase
MTNDLPESGQLVEVRRRQWVVTEVSAVNGITSKQHLVSLTSLEEDFLGEELQVVWEIEPGRRVIEKSGLPGITGFDKYDVFQSFLDAVRWGGTTKADGSLVQAPFRSGITIEDYQLDPLVRAIEMARVNLLIADDVGLGKTIEAGLVMQELLIRHRARTIFIVCPASLQIKWREEMWQKFGLEFKIIDSAYLHELRKSRGIHANPWTSFPRIIVSMDWLKGGEALRLLKDCLPPTTTYPRKFDLMILDEAHNVSPSGSTLYSIESQRTRLIRMLTPHFEHKLFLTATPHNGYQESFTSLLELLDNQRFARSIKPDEKNLRSIMVRRLKKDIVDKEGNLVFPKRVINELEVNYSKEEKAIHTLLAEYTASRNNTIESSGKNYAWKFIHLLLKKRLFSSPLAFAITLEKHIQSIKHPASRSTSKMDDRILKKRILQSEEENGDDRELEENLHEAMALAEKTLSVANDEQIAMLNEMSKWADQNRNRVDSKGKTVLKWLEDHLKTNGTFNDRRVILFTEFKATHDWLFHILTASGYGAKRLMSLHGGVDKDERERIIAAFQANPKKSPVRILVATDAASEGIDLQNFCNFLIHVEIPWNPNVMEQRNGRIDRHGQKYDEVHVWHPSPKVANLTNLKGAGEAKDYSSFEGEMEFLARAVKKLEQMREDMGSVGPVISKKIEERMAGRIVDLDTSEIDSRLASVRKITSFEKKLNEKIRKLHEKLNESTQAFNLAPNRILNAVQTALQLAEKPLLKPVSMPDVPNDSVFEVPILLGSWEKTTRGLEHPFSGERRPITFDHKIAEGRDDIVLAHLNHRLVQMCLRLLREELWKLDDVKNLHRVTCKVNQGNDMANPVVVVWSRLVITGRDHHTLHEEVIISGGEISERGLERLSTAREVQELVELSSPIAPPADIFSLLQTRFGSAENSLLQAVEGRSKDRLQSINNALDRRKQREIDDITNVLNELRAAIENEIDSENLPKQLELPGMGMDERIQIRKDIDALQKRVQQLPDELKKELASVENRYADIKHRTFPFAVEFIIPKKMIDKNG